MSYDPNMLLFGPYKLKDLTVTQTGLSNLPTTESELNNLRWLAKVLDQLTKSLGPFTVISAYRSAAVQKSVAGKNFNPNSKSFHELGMAADIYPLGQTIDTYFGRLITTEWRNKLGEIIIKPSQNSIHIGLPTQKVKGKLMILDGKYRLLTQSEEDTYSGPYKTSSTPVSFANNDPRYSMPDPSGGVYSEKFLGTFGVYPQITDLLDVSLYDPSEGEETKLNKSIIGGGVALLTALGLGIYLING
jgi:hypothetical protein